jgi:acetyl-CoA carboxylase biotin carboxyl carrier protein
VEIKHIKELMAAMGRTRTKSLKLKKEGFELEIECQENGSYRATEPLIDSTEDALLRNESAHRASLLLSRGKEVPVTPNTSVAATNMEKVDNIPANYVTSPMVGTYYSSPSPEDPPFIKVGDRVEKHTVVCIIEAMKVMNEVKAGVAGIITEILTENGHPVEFGTKLFRIT